MIWSMKIFVCLFRYVNMGRQRLLCTENGQWSDRMPTCFNFSSPWVLHITHITVFGQTISYKLENSTDFKIHSFIYGLLTAFSLTWFWHMILHLDMGQWQKNSEFIGCCSYFFSCPISVSQPFEWPMNIRQYFYVVFKRFSLRSHIKSAYLFNSNVNLCWALVVFLGPNSLL